jgi:hypothetical protein
VIRAALRAAHCAALYARLAALCAAPAAAPAVHAQTVGESRAAILLTLPASARGLALGDAWSAVSDDESALFYNPAQLARVRGTAAGGSVQHYVANTTLGAFALATPAVHGTLAFGVQVLDYGTEDEIVSNGGQQGTPTGGSVSAQDIAVTAGYGLAFGARGEWRVGTAVKLARQHVANVSGSAVAADVGAAYTAPNGWEMSAALQHLGSRLTLAGVAAPLPYTWRVAAASPRISGLFGEQFALRTMAEARQSSGGAATGVLAAEGTWRAPRDGLALSGRAGYAFRGTGDDRRPLTVGGGITLARVTVDYAYEGFDLLGATHRVGIRFGAPGSAR